MVLLEHAQAGAHRGERGGAAHDVFAEAHVDVGDAEEDEHVHHHVVHRADRLGVSEEDEHPAEPGHPARVPAPGLRVEQVRTSS